MLKGLLFDLDGVLTNSAKFHLTAWNNLAKELGINLTDDQLDSLRGISRMDSLNLILKYGDQEDKYSEAEKEKFAAEKNTKFVEQVEKYDHKCDCCNKNTMDGFVFSEEFFPEDYEKTWDSGTWFVGGTSCLRKYVSEICE